MLGHRFSKFTPAPDDGKSDFERLLKIFMQLILITSGK
jgi:Ca-activated chloride channel homolog